MGLGPVCLLLGWLIQAHPSNLALLNIHLLLGKCGVYANLDALVYSPLLTYDEDSEEARGPP